MLIFCLYSRDSFTRQTILLQTRLATFSVKSVWHAFYARIFQTLDQTQARQNKQNKILANCFYSYSIKIWNVVAQDKGSLTSFVYPVFLSLFRSGTLRGGYEWGGFLLHLGTILSLLEIGLDLDFSWIHCQDQGIFPGFSCLCFYLIQGQESCQGSQPK